MEEYNIQQAEVRQRQSGTNIVALVLAAIVLSYSAAYIFGLITYYIEAETLVLAMLPGAYIGLILARIKVADKSLLMTLAGILAFVAIAAGHFYATIGWMIGEFPFIEALTLVDMPWSLFWQGAFDEIAFSDGSNLATILMQLGGYVLGVLLAVSNASIVWTKQTKLQSFNELVNS